jgi:biopolymer transport protein ExbB
MDRVNHIRRKTTIIGSAIATALFLAIAIPASNAQDGRAAAPGATPAGAQAAPSTSLPDTFIEVPTTPDTLAATPTTPGAPAATQPGTEPSTAAPTDATGEPGATEPGAATAAEEPAPESTAPVENPYSLGSLWREGDFVSKGALIILALMSLGSWFILFIKYFDQQTLYGHGKAATRNFWSASSAEDGVNRLAKSSAFRAVAEDGLAAVHQHEGLGGQVSAVDWVGMALARSTASVNQRLQGGLPFMATVGSTAPFVGLFGTVWGIYHALIAIGLAGQASIDKVAGPVGEALIMTAIGLGVAVPAVFFYNFLVARNKVAMEQVREFAADLQTYLVGGGSGGKRRH